MYTLRREDSTNPFAVISNVVDGKLVKQAIKEELCGDVVTINDFEKTQSMDWGDTLTLDVNVTDEDGAIYEWEIEITKLVSYI